MELDEENTSIKNVLDKNNNFKKRGIRLMSVLFLVTPFFIVFGMTVDIWNISHLPKIKDGNFSFVTEPCEYKKRFPLASSLFLGVCRSKRGTLYIEIRRFVNYKATSFGIQLNPMQWLYLKRTLPFVDKSLHSISGRDLAFNINQRGTYNLTS